MKVKLTDPLGIIERRIATDPPSPITPLAESVWNVVSASAIFHP
jgi:hypothetical protein